MRAGRLRHKITIQQGTANKDTYGADVITWADYSDQWAEVRPVSGKETFLAQQRFTEATHQITTRYKSGINTRMRVVHDGRYFDIIAVINVMERNKELNLICLERGNNG